MSRRVPPRPKPVTAALLRRWRLPELDSELGKEARGQVMVVGGSDEIPGAVILAALGALRAGAGKLQIATSVRIAPHVATVVPEARVIGLRVTRAGELAVGSTRVLERELKRCDTVLIGPGMMDARAATQLVRYCEKQVEGTLVIDAGALEAFAGRRARTEGRAILTPHAGEMASLLELDREVVLERPLEIARAAAAQLGAVVVLKGQRTFIVGPDGTSFENTAGNLGLGTSGSGDTLSGVIAGLAARGAEPVQAAVWGVFLHAKAGEVLARTVGPLGFLARELLAEIPPLLGRMSRR